MTRRSTTLLIFAGLSLCLPACSVLGAITGGVKKKSVNMDKWEVTKMDVGLHEGATTICPRAPVQMSIVAEVKHKKRDKTKTMETWSGDPEGANRIGKMGFEKFDFQTTGGTVDENGYFVPSTDMLATVGGYTIATRYKDNPEKLNAENAYRPSYGCVTEAGGAGASGSTGASGPMGDSGSSGKSGSSEKAGGPGGAGGAGGQGAAGGDGAPGLNITAYATLVSTEHHDNLVLLKIEGDVQDTVLFDPKSSFTLTARGGSGGSGGAGGSGGSGGRGGSGYLGGDGGAGGAGGAGGNGGNGGPGGSINFVYDSRFPELASVVQLDASGGSAGAGGYSGSGGSKGSGGSGQGEGGQSGADGAAGPGGTEGTGGQSGPDGSTQAAAGDVSTAFGELPDSVTLL